MRGNPRQRTLLALACVLVIGSTAACSGPAPAVSGAPTAVDAPGTEAPDTGPSDIEVPGTVLPTPPASGSTGMSTGSTPPVPAGDNGFRDPRSIDVVVNKRRPLMPLDFAPAELRLPVVPTSTGNAELRPDAATAAEEMFTAAARDGVDLVLISAYRSYAEQEATYAHWVAVNGGTAAADTVSARPGFSEHQTGLAFDIGQADGTCTLQACFADTPAAIWAAEHAADFGFILRYPPGATEVTGFAAESWHFRFVGEERAAAMRADGVNTLEEHLGLPPAPSY